VHGGDATRNRDPDALARRVDDLVLGGTDVCVAEVPRALLAQHARRVAALIADDNAARHLEVAVGVRERGRVEPE
jgi:hypothetical protein